MAKSDAISARLGFCLLVILAGSLAGGCVSRQPAPVMDYGRPVDGLVTPPSMDTGYMPKTVPKTAAASALLKDAKLKISSGDLEGAAQTLERTLRIEPRNPLLWSELAYVRSQQGQLDQAEQLAAKSNSLAAEDVPLQAHNWRLIAEVRRQRGEVAAAANAEQRARELGLR